MYSIKKTTTGEIGSTCRNNCYATGSSIRWQVIDVDGNWLAGDYKTKKFTKRMVDWANNQDIDFHYCDMEGSYSKATHDWEGK